MWSPPRPSAATWLGLLSLRASRPFPAARRQNLTRTVHTTPLPRPSLLPGRGPCVELLGVPCLALPDRLSSAAHDPVPSPRERAASVVPVGGRQQELCCACPADFVAGRSRSSAAPGCWGPRAGVFCLPPRASPVAFGVGSSVTERRSALRARQVAGEDKGRGLG